MIIPLTSPAPLTDTGIVRILEQDDACKPGDESSTERLVMCPRCGFQSTVAAKLEIHGTLPEIDVRLRVAESSEALQSPLLDVRGPVLLSASPESHLEFVAYRL